MSKVRVIGVLGLMAALAGAPAAMAADYKIGVVAAVRVLEAAPQAEAAKKKLEAEFAGKDKLLLAKQKELKTMEDRAAKDGAIMSETERTRLERDIMEKRRDLKRDSDEFREDVNFRRNEEFAKIRRVALPLLRPGLVAALLLVLVEVVKELPATLMLRPFGWDTLAVKIHGYTSEGLWAQAAWPALWLCLVGLLPVWWLVRQQR